jgi:hypothetical protein
MEHEKIIIFTRYPEPGKTKTRLIPVLGKEAAAALHKKMTEQTLKTIHELSEKRSFALEISYTGGGLEQMHQWLSNKLTCKPQTKGSLGNRLGNAFAAAFNDGHKYVAAIGCDCPDLTPAILSQALDGMHTHDVVLGPARDGGYYLIGMQRYLPELFKKINWGTEQVLEQTRTVIENLGISCKLLPTLADVDRPEDL